MSLYKNYATDPAKESNGAEVTFEYPQTGQPMKPLYIFDLDGTLCNIEHRLHFLDNKADKHRWDKFHKACVNDVPNQPVIRIMEALVDEGSEVWIFSGRSEDVRKETEEWMHKYLDTYAWPLRANPALLTMRPSGDFTEDHLLKQSWMQWMLEDDRKRLVCVFDDRKRVVDMWRANGITCLQVAPGDF